VLPGGAVGRLAPTPSGLLHLGNARSFLLAWLWARREGGRVLLRIEDVDLPRCRPEYRAAILRDLEWLGLDWDELVEDQSRRFPLYREHLERLARAGLAYPCTCSRRDIEEASSAPHGDEGPIYPGTCRDRWRDAAEARDAGGRDPAWRFRWEGAPMRLRDEIEGDVVVDPASLGDFVVWRREELASYQLAVAVDDAAQGVTQVLRGRDLLQSTARQLALDDALGLRGPARWAHVPFLLDREGGRMAKRDASLALATLRENGVDPRRVVGLLARTAGLAAAVRALAPRELVDAFDLARVRREDVTMPATAV
ncbi:MAG: tRNA glutamyl-Q(34) synthetase GluQRS, partial [Candidatus Binatia bacterium]